MTATTDSVTTRLLSGKASYTPEMLKIASEALHRRCLLLFPQEDLKHGAEAHEMGARAVLYALSKEGLLHDRLD